MNESHPMPMGAAIAFPREDTPTTQLQRYLNARVIIHYASQTYNDTGTITYMDATWVELLKPNGERLLIPILAIRIIKLLEGAKSDGDAATLLRPYENKPPDEKK